MATTTAPSLMNRLRNALAEFGVILPPSVRLDGDLETLVTAAESAVASRQVTRDEKSGKAAIVSGQEERYKDTRRRGRRSWTRREKSGGSWTT